MAGLSIWGQGMRRVLEESESFAVFTYLKLRQVTQFMKQLIDILTDLIGLSALKPAF